MPTPPNILIVEDNFVIGLEACCLVERLGFRAMGPVATVREALATVERVAPAAAVLDVNLGDERVWPVAEVLDGLAVPFMLATAHARHALPPSLAKRPYLLKPWLQDDFVAAVRWLCLGPGTASSP